MESDAWNRRYQGSELIWTAEPNRFLVEEARDLPPGRALDVGCGEGRNAVWLAEAGWDVTATDFAEAGLAKGAKLADARGVFVKWVLADARTHEPEPASFDLVIVLYLHLAAADRRAAHAHASRAVAPGGRLLVVGHDSSNLTAGYGGPQDPSILFTPEEVAAELPGLEVERCERVRRPVSTEGGEVEAIDALVRAKRPQDS
jgi:SAM-dependent methyltransferase